ncbi:MAG: hypothetical protein HUJ76_11095 [Parasporobacterium sp.]|nr:hypothetical protein [Parasporobacterium sp.]
MANIRKTALKYILLITLFVLMGYVKVSGSAESADDKEKVEIQHDNVTLIIDADTYIGNVDNMIAVTVPHEMSVDELKIWTGVLFGEREPYECLSAEENKEPVPTDWNLKSELFYNEIEVPPDHDEKDDLRELKLMTFIEDKPAYIDYLTCKRKDFLLNKFTFWIQDGYQTCEIDETEEQVKIFVNRKLEELGLSEKWIIKECDQRSQARRSNKDSLFNEPGYFYDIKLVPAYYGKEVLEHGQEYLVPDVDGFSSRYYFESLRIKYSNGHIVFLEYDAPLDIVDNNISDNSPMDYADIIQCVREYVESGALKDYLLEDDVEGAEEILIRIQKAELGLSRIRLDLDNAMYNMLPVWKFSGNYEIRFIDGSVMQMIPFTYENPQMVFMCNAFDGSLIKQWRLY